MGCSEANDEVPSPGARQVVIRAHSAAQKAVVRDRAKRVCAKGAVEEGRGPPAIPVAKAKSRVGTAVPNSPYTWRSLVAVDRPLDNQQGGSLRLVPPPPPSDGGACLLTTPPP